MYQHVTRGLTRQARTLKQAPCSGHTLQLPARPGLRSRCRNRRPDRRPFRETRTSQLRQRSHSLTDVHGDTRDIGAAPLDLAGVQAGANFQIERPLKRHGWRRRTGSPVPGRRNVTRKPSPVGLTFCPWKRFHLRSTTESWASRRFRQRLSAQLAHPLCRRHDVGEQHRCEDPVGLGGMADTSQELFDLLQAQSCSPRNRGWSAHPVPEGGPRRCAGQVATVVDREPTVGSRWQHQGRHSYRRQHGPDVRLDRAIRHGGRGGRAGRQPLEPAKCRRSCSDMLDRSSL